MDLGRTLMLIGALILVMGFVLTFAGRLPLVGRLPGDVTIQGERWTVHAPIATSIIVSILLTLALNLFAWLARR
ncbi:MAG TPA: DUF2905 domain-containing protein [Candidatus Limnocylindria bacterium]|nr:DUF2905 domain-containing protein [Candidatus Limnocylindria bacterium]